MQLRTRQLPGAIWVLLSAVCFSIGGLLVKWIPWSPLSINSARNLLAAGVSFCFLRASGQRYVFNASVAAGAAGACATTTLYCLANKLTTAANAIVLQFTSPVFILLLGLLFFHRKPARRDLAACAVILTGVVFFFLDSLSAGGALGNGLAILSGLTNAFVYLAQLMAGASPTSAFLTGQLASFAIGLPSLMGERQFSAPILLAVAALGLIQQGLGYLCLTYGIQRTAPLTASLMGTVEPILNPIWVAVFYGEKIGGCALIGAAIVLGGVAVYHVSSSNASFRALK